MRRSCPRPPIWAAIPPPACSIPRGDATDPALFATDRFWFTDQISLIAGLRVDQYRAHYSSTTVGTAANPYPVTTLKSPSFLFDPRASLVWEPDQTQTYYLSWGKAATPIGTSVVGIAHADRLGGRLGADARQEREYRDRRQVQPVRRQAGPFRRAVQRDQVQRAADRSQHRHGVAAVQPEAAGAGLRRLRPPARCCRIST